MFKKATAFFSLGLVVLLTSCGTESFEGKFSTEPAKPSLSEEVLVRYVADSTNLSGSESIDMVVHYYNESLYETKAITMEKGRDGWFTPFHTADSTRGAVIQFKSKGTKEKTDNNGKKGYVVYMYDGEYPVAGAKAGYAEALTNWGKYAADLERDPKLAYELFKDEFNTNPSVKEDYYEPYFRAVSSHLKDKSQNIIEEELTGLSEKENLGKDELTLLCNWYDKIDQPEKVKKYENVLKEKFPKCRYFAEIEFQKFKDISKIKEKRKFFNEFKEKYPKQNMMQDGMVNNIVYSFQKSGDFEEGWKFMKNHREHVHPYRFYSYSNVILEKDGKTNLAVDIAKAGVQKARENYENPEDDKPSIKTAEEWKEERGSYLGYTLYAYGKSLLSDGNKSEAADKLEEAVKFMDRGNVDLNELYARALVDSKQNKKAIRELKDFIKSGNFKSSMKELYKEAYIAVNSSEEGIEDSLDKFTSAANEKMVAELEEKMINDPAPSFTLSDLAGNEVSLKDLEGKTVIVDFWATWCGPCLQSFPGMKQAVEKYENNDEVKFLFVNTWENVEDKKSNAQQFIKKNDYPFHVLLDKETKVVSKFKVSGIPTKFVIDKTGSIRFKSVGFSGNTEELVKELETMIELTQAES